MTDWFEQSAIAGRTTFPEPWRGPPGEGRRSGFDSHEVNGRRSLAGFDSRTASPHHATATANESDDRHEMTKILGAWTLSAVALLCSCSPAPAKAADPCGDLSRLPIQNITITSAQVVSAGAFRLPPGRRPPAEFFTGFNNLPPFCRVQATITPSRDSRIRAEVWLPVSGWNGRLLGAGNGGFGGTIAYYKLGEAINSGYVGASTDTGHEGGARDSRWSVGHPEKQTDFDYRAIHEMTTLAKTMISAFYTQPLAHSYFASCSNGGRQGLMEAERYPTDYDGIMAGAPAYHFGFQTFVSGKLDAFRDRGGKLIIYHGGADNPEGSVEYYRNLASRMGKERVDQFAQLYLVPGMGHCGSGDVPNDFGQWLRPGADAQHSMLKSLEAWVESGAAPKGVVATQFRREGDAASGAVRTRVLCPFPARSRAAGTC